MASTVDGCLYNLLKVVPGRPSRYSNDRKDDVDIMQATTVSAPHPDFPLDHVAMLIAAFIKTPRETFDGRDENDSIRGLQGAGR